MSDSVPRNEYNRVVAERDRLRNRNDVLELENACLRSAQRENMCDSSTEPPRADIVKRRATVTRSARPAIQHTPRALPSERNTVLSLARSQTSRASRLTYTQ